MSDWSNELVFEFLELYKAEHIIYDLKHPDNKYKKKVNEAWTRIKDTLSVDCTVAEIKKKKDSLMASFRHHLRRKKASIKSATSSGEVYKPTWYAYDVMEGFLGSVYDCDPTYNTEKSTPPDEHVYEQDVSVKEEISSNCDVPPTQTPTFQHHTQSRLITQRHSKRPQEFQHANQEIDQTFAILQDRPTRKKDDGDDECDLYGKLLAKKLRRIPEFEREQLMYEIDGIFLRASKSCHSYTDHSSSSLASPACALSSVEVHIQSPPPT